MDQTPITATRRSAGLRASDAEAAKLQRAERPEPAHAPELEDIEPGTGRIELPAPAMAPTVHEYRGQYSLRGSIALSAADHSAQWNLASGKAAILTVAVPFGVEKGYPIDRPFVELRVLGLDLAAGTQSWGVLVTNRGKWGFEFDIAVGNGTKLRAMQLEWHAMGR